TRDKRAPSAPRPVLVRRLLSPLADPSVARQRLPGCSPHPTAKQRQGDCDSASRRASPSLRTPRRLTCFPRLHHLLRSPTVWRAMPSRAESRWRTPTAQTDQRDREINSCVSSHPTRRSPESDTRWSFANAQDRVVPGNGFLSHCGIAAPMAALQVYRGRLSENARRMTSVSARSSASACTRRLLIVAS